MKKEAKITYETPSAIVFDVKIEGVICASGGLGDRPDYTPDDTNPFGGG